MDFWTWYIGVLIGMTIGATIAYLICKKTIKDKYIRKIV
jgi:uncharacterized membrane protein YdjX (TVP38/TMEM64 family)